MAKSIIEGLTIVYAGPNEVFGGVKVGIGFHIVSSFPLMVSDMKTRKSEYTMKENSTHFNGCMENAYKVFLMVGEMRLGTKAHTEIMVIIEQKLRLLMLIVLNVIS